MRRPTGNVQRGVGGESRYLHVRTYLDKMADAYVMHELQPWYENLGKRQVIQALDAAPHECFFWRTHAGAELDLLVVRGARRIGVEVKRTTTPAITPSMRSAMTDLKLSQLYVVHAGERSGI